MKLTYVFHSCFVIETDNISIIIDYYKDAPNNTEGVTHQELAKNEKHIYVLSTHSHADHFNPEILGWKEKYPNIKYIFSSDILHERLAKQNDAVYMNKLDIYEDDTLKVKAFGSTDIGISFLIEVEGKKIFHAGDLNNWHWKDESTPEEISEAEKYYLDELSLLAQSANHLDLAMFPVDSRLGSDYMLGAKQFLDKIEADVFAPMHFGLEYDKANAFESYAEKKNSRFFAIKQKGQSIDF
ncbi:MBL fold metallo-hydrolase [Dysgonomonas sp. 520]|uniref:MBL fold metallo-hydrolase n=1 Tax=Dysgonomonas sp. 520 TaxID=2302931 RepID=UPI0013CFCCD1|nr:MBL fold metallo-hydrolase [Dysgonomonas sp. 520]NDW09469.1 MBL fold metallo-hydrolase [Dysgonomonas sp. 520]